jgi:DNA-binding transcriptional MocR family regulator
MPIDTGHDTELVASEAQPALENLTLWQRVHTHLREEILSGELPAGSELQEVALSKTLGVSRGPIREAIGRLAAEGLVTVRPRRGAVVRALSSEEFIEAYQVREALETMAVRLAVLRSSRATTSLRWSAIATRCPPAALLEMCRDSSRRTPLSTSSSSTRPTTGCWRTSTGISEGRSTGIGSARSSCVVT